MKMGEDEGGLFKLKAPIRSGPSSNDPKKIDHLLALHGDKGKTSLVKVVYGCERFSTQHLQVIDPQKSGLLIWEGESIGHEYIQLIKNWMMLVHGSDNFNTYSSTTRRADETTFVLNHQVLKERAKSLGVDYIPVEESIKPSIKLLRA